MIFKDIYTRFEQIGKHLTIPESRTSTIKRFLKMLDFCSPYLCNVGLGSVRSSTTTITKQAPTMSMTALSNTSGFKTLTLASAIFLLMLGATVSVSSCKGCQVPQGSAASSTELITDAASSTIRISSGRIAGYIDGGVYIYKGIPYAKAERFAPPQSPDPWEGVRSCRAYGPVCPQVERSGWQSDESAFSSAWNDGFPGEDCMRVNVWTPSIKDGPKRPVMVWLHGGGFETGSGQEWPSYDGRSLAAGHDVVVVTLNHRLNVLGFLDLSAFGDKYRSSGNVGMMDIVKALEWVRDNISAFGGDPSNVTIFGQSGGGGKVSTLLATPSAQGLFHKAIVQSGSQLRVMEQKYSRMIGSATVRALGISPSSIDDIKTVPYKDLLEAGNKAIEQVKALARADSFETFIFGWAPTVDGEWLPAHPFDGKAPELSKDIPMIIGTTLTEFCPSAYFPSLRGISKEQVDGILEGKWGERKDGFTKALRSAYPGATPQDFLDYDVTFRPMAARQASLKVRDGNAPVWNYIFSWESPVLDGVLRSSHCMEIPFVFDNVALHNTITGGGEQAIELGKMISTAWTLFARTGDPNGAPGLPEWKKVEAGHDYVMYFGKRVTLRDNPDSALLEFLSNYPYSIFP